MDSLDDVASSLPELNRQLEEVSQLLLDDPDNEELQAIYDNLTEVIQLAQDLEPEQVQAAEAGPHEPSQQTSTLEKQIQQVPCKSHLPPLLPPEVAEQLRKAQQRAALSGQGPATWAVGAKCRAIYSGDGNWYNAAVESVTETGSFVVVFEGYDSREEVGKDAIQLRMVDDEGGYKGVAAPKRRKVDESGKVQEMPKWLEVKATDDEKTKQKKRKLAKAYKSKARFARLDLQQKQKADAWRQFVAGGKGIKTQKRKNATQGPK